jgi:hypothetical protein
MESLEARQLLSGSIVITTGGTYTGTYTSTNPNQPAITIDTTQPVTITNSNISGEGDLIFTGVSGVNLTVKDCTATGVNPNVAGVGIGEFLEADNTASLTVENNTISNVGAYALDVHGFTGTGSQTVTILDNSFSNINGMYSNGSGGYETTGSATPHAIILDNVVGVAGINIGWNQIVNTVGESYITDVINIYESSGTSASPIDIHNNLINGLWSPSPGTISDSGCGIITDGGTSPETAYVSITNNTILNCGNSGIGIAAGNNITVTGNTCASTGEIPGTSTMNISANVGIYTWDQMSGGSTSNYHNITVGVNTVGWMNSKGVRNDIWNGTTSGTSWASYTKLSGTINDAEISSLQSAWTTSATAAGVTIGVPSASSSTSTTTQTSSSTASAGTTQVVSLKSYFNRTGIFTDGQTTSATGLDTDGYGYSASQIGSTVTWNGLTYTLGSANQNDVVSATGQTITLPSGAYASLDLLATGVNGNQTNKEFVIHYSNGTTQTIALNLSDWIFSAGYSDETIVKTMTYRDGNTGIEQNENPVHLYGYVLNLESGLTITSITLPNDSNIEILGLSVVG